MYSTSQEWVWNFGDLPSQLTSPDTSRVRVVSIPYEGTVTYGRGTHQGPRAIIEASRQLELWDEELQCEPSQAGIVTEVPLQCLSSGPEDVLKQIHEHVRGSLDKAVFGVYLGGEHSITVGVVRALVDIYPRFSVLQLDAHADLRDSYLGSSCNHACVMRRVGELVPFVGMGIRSFCREEAQFIREKGVVHQSAFQVEHSNEWQAVLESVLQDDVYLTVDVDVFDPSFVPSVGTPEPGGLSWQRVLDIIRFVASRRRLIGADVVELAPIPGLVAPDFLVAKLVYKIIGYATMFSQGKSTSGQVAPTVRPPNSMDLP